MKYQRCMISVQIELWGTRRQLGFWSAMGRGRRQHSRPTRCKTRWVSRFRDTYSSISYTHTYVFIYVPSNYSWCIHKGRKFYRVQSVKTRTSLSQLKPTFTCQIKSPNQLDSHPSLLFIIKNKRHNLSHSLWFQNSLTPSLFKVFLRSSDERYQNHWSFMQINFFKDFILSKIVGGLNEAHCFFFILDPNQYMSFGLSGNPERNVMIGGDVVVAWVDKQTLQGYAIDYFLDAKSQCSGGRGSCPDNRIQVINSFLYGRIETLWGGIWTILTQAMTINSFLGGHGLCSAIERCNGEWL